jgi:exo-beta-1,3-glucanase (GH17 family)
LVRCASGAGPPAAHQPSALANALRETTWIAYAPTNFDPGASPPVLPSGESVRLDLVTLRDAGFDGLITYGADVEAVPRIAEEVGFRHLLLGVWTPSNAAEMDLVARAARSDRVLGVIVGNEGLMFARYDLAALRSAIEEMRRATGKPVSTTEVIDRFFTTPELVEMSDFVTANAHPYFQNLHDPAGAADWTARAFDALVAHVPGKPVLLKEVGLPSAGDPASSENAQFEYYDRLRRTPVVFAYFEAFDALFKQGPVEQSWGLFRADRTPKRAAAAVRRVALRP